MHHLLVPDDGGTPASLLMCLAGRLQPGLRFAESTEGHEALPVLTEGQRRDGTRGSRTLLGAGPAAFQLCTALAALAGGGSISRPLSRPPCKRVRKVSVRWCFSLDPINLSCTFSAFLLPSRLPQLLSQILAVCWSWSPPHLVMSYAGADITTPAWDL